MCTIALAKVQRNYNCYNVYFYECLPLRSVEMTKGLSCRAPSCHVERPPVMSSVVETSLPLLKTLLSSI